MDAWDPGQYLKFAGERLRPALDLLARVAVGDPASVYDLGCGSGNTTRLLVERWPRAAVAGVDSSAAMLGEARAERGAGISWIEADLTTWSPSDPADVVYSNAALQWLDDHPSLFPRLMEGVAPGGWFAVQMPRNHAAASHVAISESVAAGPWRERLEPLLREAPVASPEAYHDLLAPLSAGVDIWETIYTHVLEGDDAVVEWTKGTTLRPLLESLDDDGHEGFLADYRGRIAAAYPRRADGTTLFPFRRLFIIARK